MSSVNELIQLLVIVLIAYFTYHSSDTSPDMAARDQPTNQQNKAHHCMSLKSSQAFCSQHSSSTVPPRRCLRSACSKLEIAVEFRLRRFLCRA